MEPTPKIPLSVIVMTRNESANIDRCLESLDRFDQIFIVDSHSTDDTVEKALRYNVTIVPFKWNGQYPKKKQWCLDHLPFRHPWVLWVDADESITPALAEEIFLLLSHAPSEKAYFIKGQPVFLGKKLRFGQWNLKVALTHRHATSFPLADDLWIKNMWEVEGHYQPTITGTIGCLHSPMVHHDHKSFYAWIDRHNRYSDWEAGLTLSKSPAPSLNTNEGQRRYVLKKIWTHLPCKPMALFIYSYLVRGGFLDGKAGFHYALSRAFYRWMISVKRLEEKKKTSS